MFKNFSSKCFLKLLSFVMFLSLSSRRFHRRVAALSWNIRRLALDRLRDKMIERKQVLGKNIISIRRDKISNFARANFAPCKGIQGSLGFWLPQHGFRIPGIEFRILCQWSLNSGFQSLVGFQIPWAVFWIPKPKILDFTSKTLPDERIRISLHGATNYPSFITFSADGLLQKLYLIQHSTWPFSGRAAELVPKGVSCHLPMQSCGLFDPGRTVAVVPGHGTQIRLSLWGWKERRLHKVHGARPVGEKEPDGQETGGNNKKNIQVRQTFM